MTIETGTQVYSGLKILELGAGAASPVATRYFAEHGATVIRIESAKRPDFLRMIHLTAENHDEPNILEKAPMFVMLNPNKQSLTLNMKKPQSVELVKQLVHWADVVSENFAPGVMDRFGLDYETLRREREDLIMVSCCLFGQTGPQRTYPGFGGQGSAISGFNQLTGHPDHEAHGPYSTITDSLTPRYVALAIAAALLERRKSGCGQYIDVSQIEAGIYSLSEIVVRYSANGEVENRRENANEFAAPHGIYPCLGDDRWIAIEVHSDEEWASLVAAMGTSAWVRQGDYETTASRLANRSVLDDHLGQWTSQFEPHALMADLQAAGVEAGAVQTFADLHRDPQLEYRKHFEVLPHAHLGDLSLERCGFRITGLDGGYYRPGPLLGEDNESILGEILGLSEARIEELIAEEVVV
jgi:benzylsuccinate CoA-transferase BbsF subunit